MAKVRTCVYVDGFNVYFGIRYTPYRWLNLGKLATLLVSNAQIERIRYFTARIEARGDPEQPARQDTYLRALGTIPRLSIHYGRFLSSQVRMAHVHPALIGPRTALVWKTEEKGSDVNLATYLLADGFQKKYEQAVVISNDTDLLAPIRMICQELRLPVIVLNPTEHYSKQMHEACTRYQPISVASLRAAEFDTEMADAVGPIRRPGGWDGPKPKL